MAILVTGGAGFIGSHIVDKLIYRGYEVIIVDNLSGGKISNINPKAKFYNIDLKNPNLERIFIENNINFVSHHAAQVSVGVSMRDPILDLEANILGSANLLKFCKKYHVKKVILASTAAVYGDPQYLPVDEDHKIKALSFYSLSKLTMENYVKLFGLNHVIFRYSNVYGPRQDAHGEAGVVSIFIDRMLSGQQIEIQGDGEQTRDFIYVEDISNANIMAIESNIINETINISTNSEISINTLFNTLKDITNYRFSPNYTKQRDGDIKNSVLDNNKAKSILNWDTSVKFREGLSRTLQEQKDKIIH